MTDHKSNNIIDQFDLNLDEKYRPKKINEIVGQLHFVLLMMRWIQIGIIPQLLLVGHPGTGKTSFVRLLTRYLFGKNWRLNLMNLMLGFQGYRGHKKCFVIGFIEIPFHNRP